MTDDALFEGAPSPRGPSCAKRLQKAMWGRPAAESSDLTAVERAVLDTVAAAPDNGFARMGTLEAASGFAARQVREIIAHLRFTHKQPILGWPGEGYSFADKPEDVKRYMSQCQEMGRDYFALGSVVGRTTVDVVAGQMILDLFGREGPAPSTDGQRTWELFLQAGKRRIGMRDVLGRLLDHMSSNPTLYKEDLEELGKKYGAVLLDSDRVAKLRKLQRELGELLPA
jgi:hypothetical protein